MTVGEAAAVSVAVVSGSPSVVDVAPAPVFQYQPQLLRSRGCAAAVMYDPAVAIAASSPSNGYSPAPPPHNRPQLLRSGGYAAAVMVALAVPIAASPPYVDGASAPRIVAAPPP